jgi:hypothetical protein
VGGAVYVHRDALHELGRAVDARVAAAAARAGDPPWNLARIEGDVIMLGRVPGLGSEPHPALRESWTVRGRRVQHRRYKGDSAPIYHRTELLLPTDHPARPELLALSRREAAAGLLGRSDIGTVRAWRRAQGSANRPAEASCKTAIKRQGPSMPVRWLHERGALRGPVLDFGAGHGADARWLTQRGLRVTRYDPCHGPVRLPSGRYQTVLATYVLNTVPPAVQSKILDQIRSRLRPGGTAFLTVRSDVRTGTTGAGTYQRDVRLRLPLEGSPGAARIYRLEG